MEYTERDREEKEIEEEVQKMGRESREEQDVEGRG